MKLFDFVKILFSTSNKYEELTPYERGKNRFMIMRFMSIQYPDTANLLNINGTNPTYVNDSFRMITKRFKTTPRWIWTKVSTKKEVTDDFVPKEETIRFYLKKNEATMRDYKEVLKSVRKYEMLKELEELEKLLEENGYEEQ